MMHQLLPAIYPITSTELSGLSHAEQIKRLAEGGATLVQLREKSSSPRLFFDQAVEAVSVARGLGVRLVINDRVDIALAAEADGVHLGQEDLPPAMARQLLGGNRIIGLSTHSLEQALAAEKEPVDYVAVGPVFQTATKENPEPAVGLEMVSMVAEAISKPVVAIGGIRAGNLASVLGAGAASVAIISDLYSTGDIGSRFRDLLAVSRQASPFPW